MSKAKLSQSEWQQVKDAPYWVHAVLAAAEGRSALLTRRKESRALDEAIKSYSSGSALVRDIIADDSDPAKGVEGASESNAERALSKIADIVQEKLGDEELDALNDFLLYVGQSVAGAAGEGVMGLGKKVSDKEAAALESISEALRATSAHKTERRLARDQQQKEAWQARQDAEKRARAEKEREEAEAKKRAEAEAKKREEAEAKKREEAAAKARQEAEAKRKAEQEKEREKALADKAREAQARQKEAREAAEQEAPTVAGAGKAGAAAAAGGAAAQEASPYIAEHEVVSGDNLSMISQKYYGTQIHWGKIYEANKEVIGANPSLIRPGQRLRIPRL